ncbi:MAG TPA: ATP-binding protein [bacterium]|nr:ATP-binding protein [bacterium]
MIIRTEQIKQVRHLIESHPVVGIIGARQVGKTTLARQVAEQIAGGAAFFDLENPEDLARLSDPMLGLKGLKGLVVIDEIQRLPGLFTVLRVLVDRSDNNARFLILGSASPDLLRQSSESLAGRIIYHELFPFSLLEVGSQEHRKLWLRGGFPRSFLARTLPLSDEWRKGFIRTFLERDIPQFGFNINATTLRRFLTMLAHYHGQLFNASEIGRSLGISHVTIRRYLDMLSAALVVRQLQPWFVNIAKRQIKAPKIYLADSGLLHSLLNIKTANELEGHPKVGASWEGFVIEQLVIQLGLDYSDCFFWGTYSGAELDLLFMRGQKRIGVEIKRTTTPHLTASMHSTLETLKLTHLYVIHAGDHSFPLADQVHAVSFSHLLHEFDPTLFFI